MAQALLIYRRLGECEFASFFQEVDADQSGFFIFFLVVEGDPRKVVLDVGRHDGFRPVHHEEWRVAGGTVWSRSDAPEYGW